MTHKITAADAGTWLDGSQGWHNTYRVIDRAVEYGFVVSGDDRKAVDAYREGNDTFTRESGETVDLSGSGWIGEISDDATEYLQSLAPDGYVFEWDCGELSLQETEPE